jgi:hypothetical protein
VPLTRASLSPNSGSRTAVTREARAGLLDIEISGTSGPLLDLVERNLALYDVPWTLTGTKRVTLEVDVVAAPAVGASGGFLECAQMLVDSSATGLRATTTHGAELMGDLGKGFERWRLTAPTELVDGGWWPEIEDLISLVVTTGWRRAGWVPLHAAGLERDGRGVLVCATGGGGKTTFSLGLVRRGWRLLGDDKLLVGDLDGTLVVAAIKQVLNVDPAIVRWFGEVGDLSGLPEYSAWSPKRRVPLSMLWPAAHAVSAPPTHLVSLVRRAGSGGVSITPISEMEALTTLMRQTVFPRDPAVARPIVAMLGRVAAQVRGHQLVVHDDAYADESTLAAVEAALL